MPYPLSATLFQHRAGSGPSETWSYGEIEMAEEKGWIVTTSSERAIKDIASDLRNAGFSVGRVLEEVGSITGAAADETITRLRAIPGVVDVSPDRPIDIGPPDSGDTW